MGCPEFLSLILPVAGRPVDLRDFSSGCMFDSTSTRTTLSSSSSSTTDRRRRERQRSTSEQQKRRGKKEDGEAAPPPPPLNHTTNHSNPQQEEDQQEEECCSCFRRRRRRHCHRPTTTRRERCGGKRPLRIGVDVSGWIVRACMGFSHMLAEERHLSNFGRATLLSEQQQQQHDDKELRQQQLLQSYAARCTQYVLSRIECLIDACRNNDTIEAVQASNGSTGSTMECLSSLSSSRRLPPQVLVVLDGATPPIKTQACHDRRAQRSLYQYRRDDPSINVTGLESLQTQRVIANQRAGAGPHYGLVVAQIIRALHSYQVQPQQQHQQEEQQQEHNEQQEQQELSDNNYNQKYRCSRCHRRRRCNHYGSNNNANSNKMPFLVAPYEADGQLAYLAQQGWIDLIVTDDSDLVAFGAAAACPILYKLGNMSRATQESSAAAAAASNNDNHTTLTEASAFSCGVILRHEDLSAAVASSSSLDFTDWSPIMFAVLFVAAGSEYSKKLRGIGIKTAYEIVRKAFLERVYEYENDNDDSNDTDTDEENGEKRNRTKNNHQQQQQSSPLSVVFDLLFEATWDSALYSMTKDNKDNKNDSNSRAMEVARKREEYMTSFLEALCMYRHPVVYDPIHGRCVTVGDLDKGGGGDPELTAFPPYAFLIRDAATREQQVTGKPFDAPLARWVAEGWISPRTLQPYPTTTYNNNTDSSSLLPEDVQLFLQQRQQQQSFAATTSTSDTNTTAAVNDNNDNINNNSDQAAVADNDGNHTVCRGDNDNNNINANNTKIPSSDQSRKRNYNNNNHDDDDGDEARTTTSHDSSKKQRARESLVAARTTTVNKTEKTDNDCGDDCGENVLAHYVDECPVEEEKDHDLLEDESVVEEEDEDDDVRDLLETQE